MEKIYRIRMTRSSGERLDFYDYTWSGVLRRFSLLVQDSFDNLPNYQRWCDMPDEELYVVFLQEFEGSINVERDIIGSGMKSNMHKYLINVHDYEMGTNHPFFGDSLSEARKKCGVWLYKTFEQTMKQEGIDGAGPCYIYMCENFSDLNIHISEDIVDLSCVSSASNCPRELLLLTQ